MAHHNWEIYQTKTFSKLLQKRKRANSQRFEKEMENLQAFLKDLLHSLKEQKPVPKQWKLHQLTNFRLKGKLYEDVYDAHLMGDLVLILHIDFEWKRVVLLFLGSHSERE